MSLPGDMGPPEIVVEYTYVPVVVYSFVIFGVAACIAPYLSWRFIPKYRTISSYERFDWNSRVLSVFHSVLASGLGIYNFLYDGPTWEDKVWGTSYLPRATIAITTGYITSDLILMLVGFPIKESVFYIFHHLAVIGAYIFNVLCGPLTYFGNIRVIAEFSTPFVNLRWMLYLLGYKETKLYLYNGFVMLGAFFAVRVGVLPFFYYILIKSFIEEGFRRLPLSVTLTCFTCSIGLDIINIFWFFKMSKGAYRMLKKSAAKSDQKSDQHIKAQ